MPEKKVAFTWKRNGGATHHFPQHFAICLSLHYNSNAWDTACLLISPDSMLEYHTGDIHHGGNRKPRSIRYCRYLRKNTCKKEVGREILTKYRGLLLLVKFLEVQWSASRQDSPYKNEEPVVAR